MKPIEIKEKFRPFSQAPGVHVPYPLLSLVFVIYPSEIKIIDWKRSPKTLLTLSFKFKSPCEKFTVFSDPMKGTIEVHVKLEDNFATLCLSYHEKSGAFLLNLSRFKEDYLSFEVRRPHKVNIIRRQLTKKKPLVLFKNLKEPLPKHFEKLFLGSHKKQEAEKIYERRDLKEFLPHWFLLGQTVAEKCVNMQKEGTLVFLNFLRQSLEKKEHEKIATHLKHIICSSFSPMMVPHLDDFRHWGFFLPRHTSSRTSPWSLLYELYLVLREMFLKQKENDLYILPHLPPELFCGKITSLRQGNLTIHLEWTKKMIRRMIVFASKGTTLHLHFNNEIKRFRLRVGKASQGMWALNNSEFTFKRSKAYFFDRFEK